MEDKKSASCNNQVENCKRDFQLSDSLIENESHSKMKQYGRDILLQLRLHPLSLQKPSDLPNIEVAKEKLYLHNITDSSSASADKYMDFNTCHASLKPEYCNMKHEYSYLPHYLNRLYPYCSPSHVYNGLYQNASSKFRSSFHTYCNTLKKHCGPSHSCYKDFPEECMWAKRCFASSEDVWGCYPSHVNTNFAKKKEILEGVPKSRKKLSIIDPATGKNVLEAVTAIHLEQQNNAYAVEENSESYNEDITVGKYAGDYFCNDDAKVETLLHVSNEVYDDTVPCSSEDKLYYEKLKSPDTLYESEFFAKTVEDNSNPEIFDTKTIADSGKENNSCINAKDELMMSTVDPPTAGDNVKKLINSVNVQDICETPKLPNKQVLKTFPNTEVNNPMDVHGNCQAHNKKECNLHLFKEGVSKQSDSTRESLKQLREKIYSLRQEQQKMAILQSFLRYKKYQLEENARNLDEKRIEIANWECNLFNKAKRLHDKELWLDSKSEILYNKAQQLSEKEKVLNKEGGKFSNESQFLRSGPRETQFSEKKYAFDNCGDTTWDDIPKVKSNYKVEGSNEYSYLGCDSNSSKVSESSHVEKCKSNACSLDELERNIVLIEKMHSSNEAGDTINENKTELASSNAVQKKDDSTSCDPIGYSKGRRYLPEHIKYWLNKRDKSAL